MKLCNQCKTVVIEQIKGSKPYYCPYCKKNYSWDDVMDLPTTITEKEELLLDYLYREGELSLNCIWIQKDKMMSGIIKNLIRRGLITQEDNKIKMTNYEKEDEYECV